MTEPELELPYGWAPREYQLPVWHALEEGYRRAYIVWHRRAGKGAVMVNWCVTQAAQRVGLYWHVLPTYKQGRKIIWDGMTKEGRKFTDYFPPELILRKNEQEMTIWMTNGSLYQVVGADDVDKLVGANPVGVVLDEYALMDRSVWNFFRPILAENGGWAVFTTTPRGRNHAYELWQRAQKNKRWFTQLLTVDDTGAVSPEAIQEDRDSGMPEELVQQEYWCSWDAPLVGSYYGDQVNAAMKDPKRITKVPWDPAALVTTAWDLGVGDATAIVFAQFVGKEVRIIDYYSSMGKGLDHYAKILQEKPYAYKEAILPHDAAQRSIESGKTRVAILQGMGFRCRVLERLPIEDGIAAVRALWPMLWIDEEKCEVFIRAAREYRKDYDTKSETYRETPRHDWTSNPMDALRYLALGYRVALPKRPPIHARVAMV